MFETLFGAEVPSALKIFLGLIVVVGTIWAIAWFVQRVAANRFGAATGRGRQPRLAVVDKAPVDARRSLMIVRRDNVEHLLMVGGPTDVVVESNIVRATGASRDREASAARPAPPAADTPARTVPLGEATMWPLQPQPETNQRPSRVVGIEESVQWTWHSQSDAPRSAHTDPAHTDMLAELADELTGGPAPQRETNPAAGRKAATPPPSRPAATPPATPTVEPAGFTAGTDQNLAEMAHRLEAALRRPNETRPMPETPAAAKTETPPPRPAAPEPKSTRAEAKPAQPKSPYDSLEQEMASLLGRPPGKP